MSDSIVPTEYRQAEGTREDRGLILAATKQISRNRSGGVVPSQTLEGAQYLVAGATCTCPDFVTRGLRCKHQIAVEIVEQRETSADGTTRIEPVPVCRTACFLVHHAASTAAMYRRS